MAVPQARMAWIRDHIDPDAPDRAHIVLGIDCSERADIGQRRVSTLFNAAMEGDDGVFYLLPSDLCYEVTRTAGVVTVELLTIDAASGDDAPIGWITLMSAAIPFPDENELPGPPLVVIGHEGVVGLDDLVAAIPEVGIHIVGPKPGA